MSEKVQAKWDKAGTADDGGGGSEVEKRMEERKRRVERKFSNTWLSSSCREQYQPQTTPSHLTSSSSSSSLYITYMLVRSLSVCGCCHANRRVEKKLDDWFFPPFLIINFSLLSFLFCHLTPRLARSAPFIPRNLGSLSAAAVFCVVC